MRTVAFLPTSFAAPATTTSIAVDLADRRRRRREADLASFSSSSCPPRPATSGCEVDELALGEDARSGPSGRASSAHEEEAAAASPPRSRRAASRPGPTRSAATCGMELDPERLGARARRASARSRRSTSTAAVVLRDDDAVAGAGRALAGEDLARAVGDVLARHLDEAERRDLDDVGLRPVALELVAQRLLDRGAVLRVRHVDEVDDDDPADVAQPQLAHDLLDGLEVVLRDRVLEPRARGLRARADEAAGVDVDRP